MRRKIKVKDSLQIELLMETMEVIKEMCEDPMSTNFGVNFFLRDQRAKDAFWTKMAERGIVESDITKNVTYCKKERNKDKVSVYLY